MTSGHNNPIILIVLVALNLVMVSAAGCGTAGQPQNPGGGIPDPNNPASQDRLITLDALKAHNTADDCWVVYDGKVYDVTSWLPIHPGGPGAISRFCGTQDFQANFYKKHNMTKVELFMLKAALVGLMEGSPGK